MTVSNILSAIVTPHVDAWKPLNVEVSRDGRTKKIAFSTANVQKVAIRVCHVTFAIAIAALLFAATAAKLGVGVGIIGGALAIKKVAVTVYNISLITTFFCLALKSLDGIMPKDTKTFAN